MRKQTFIKPGDKFNRLEAVEYLQTRKHHRRWFLFRCDCGKTVELSAETVISGNTKSCGCLRRDSTIQKYGLKAGEASMRQVILQYKRHCKDKKREWKISEAQFKEIAGRPCFYCGIKPERIKKSPHNTGNFVYNGLDRKDSTKEYTVSNVVPCCRRCNLSKNDMTINEFAIWINRVSAMSQQWGTLNTGGNLANSAQQPYADAIAQLETAA